MEITKAQVKQIHVLKTKLGWDDETYRNALRPYFVDTSKELSFSEARTFISELEAAVFKFEVLQLATDKQKKLIIARWYGVTRVSGVKEKMTALNTFLDHRFGVKNLNKLRRDMVEKVVKALSVMAQQAESEHAEEVPPIQSADNERNFEADEEEGMAIAGY